MLVSFFLPILSLSPSLFIYLAFARISLSVIVQIRAKEKANRYIASKPYIEKGREKKRQESEFFSRLTRAISIEYQQPSSLSPSHASNGRMCGVHEC